MTGFILAAKSEQSQYFTKTGERIPVTFLKTKPCYLVGIKTQEKHGYNALKLGCGQTKNIKKPTSGELNKAGIKTPLHFLREFRINQLDKIKIKVGEEIKPELFFKVGDLVSVTGISKGKGFQGVVKRHSFKGGPHTHGQSHSERAPGSVGSTTTPGRLYRGKRMAGRMGGERITIKNLKIIEIKEDGLLVKGLVPGAKGQLLEIRA